MLPTSDRLRTDLMPVARTSYSPFVWLEIIPLHAQSVSDDDDRSNGGFGQRSERSVKN